jgi:hypothetical protein
VGLVLAHQNLGQFKDGLDETVATNTAIKMVGGPSAEDARALSGNMHCAPEFLLSMRKSDREKKSEFACFVRDHTSCALPLTVSFGTMESQPTLTKAAFDDLRAKNRARVSQPRDDSDTTPPGANGFHPKKPDLL